MAEIKSISATASGYMIGDGSASPPVLKGARIYGFQVIGGATGSRAVFYDGGPSGTELIILECGIDGAHTVMLGEHTMDAHTDVYLDLAVSSGAKATIFVDKPTSDWLRRNT